MIFSPSAIYTKKDISLLCRVGASLYDAQQLFLFDTRADFFRIEFSQFAAQTDRPGQFAPSQCTLPTIFDSLNNAGISAAATTFKQSSLFLGLWGSRKYLLNTFLYGDFLAECGEWESTGGFPISIRFYTLTDDGNRETTITPHARQYARAKPSWQKTFHAVAERAAMEEPTRVRRQLSMRMVDSLKHVPPPAGQPLPTMWIPTL